LYGLKQSPRKWNKRFNEFVARIGFKCSMYDTCVYFKFLADGLFVILLLYVDDILITSNSKLEVRKVKFELNSESERKNLGAANKILGIEISK